MYEHPEEVHMEPTIDLATLSRLITRTYHECLSALTRLPISTVPGPDPDGVYLSEDGAKALAEALGVVHRPPVPVVPTEGLLHE